MNSKALFIKTITQEYISKTQPDEVDFLFKCLEESEKNEFILRVGNSQDIPFGFGGSDLLEMFKSPIVIQVLANVWDDLLAPIFVEVMKKRLAAEDTNKLSEQALKTLSRKKMRDYIRGKAMKKLLSEEEADDLAVRILDWIRRHPEDIKNITAKSTK